jgi:hypothetical protein
MSLFKLIDPRQCRDILPVRDSVGSMIVIEHRCVLPLGHDGFHRDIAGNVWVNQADIMRQRGAL